MLENMVINECKFPPGEKEDIHVKCGSDSWRCFLSAKQLVDLDDFVEMTKNYAQGIVPSQNVRPDQRESFERQDSSDEVKDQTSKNIHLLLECSLLLYILRLCVCVCSTGVSLFHPIARSHPKFLGVSVEGG